LYGRKAFVEAGVTLHNTSKCVDHPLKLAAQHDRVGVVYFLTIFGAVANIPNSKNITALHLVPASVSLDSIKLFQHKVMSFSLTDTEDCTPIHVSAGCRSVEATNVL